MTLEFEGGNAVAASLVILLLILLAFGLMGKRVTPVMGNEPQWLTPARWRAYQLQKTAYRETKKLIRDARRLQGLLEADAPDPVAAMLLAQAIYATHQSGSSATAAARGALIAAAEAAVRAATGESARDEAAASFREALARIEALGVAVGPRRASAPTPAPVLQYLPIIQIP